MIELKWHLECDECGRQEIEDYNDGAFGDGGGDREDNEKAAARLGWKIVFAEDIMKEEDRAYCPVCRVAKRTATNFPGRYWYKMGNARLPMLKMRAEDKAPPSKAIVQIRTNLASVYAEYAYPYEDGVDLINVQVVCATPGLNAAGQAEVVQYAVTEVYERLGEATFTPREVPQ